MKKNLKEIFSFEELDILRTIILERSTFYTRKVVDYKVLMLQAENEELIRCRQKNYEYNSKVKKVLDTFHDYLLDIYREKD